ncbi:head decoration protein [Adonisia turfae]
MSYPVNRFGARQVLSNLVVEERDLSMSRETRTLLGGVGAIRSIVQGQVLGARLYGAPTIDDNGMAVTKGSLGAVVLGDRVELGDYQFTARSANDWSVTTPAGLRLADAETGAPYGTEHLSATITAGGAPFAAGDRFTVTVASGDGKLVALDPAASDGSQLADCVSFFDQEAPDGVDLEILTCVRDAVLVDSGLVWPDGFTAFQIAFALDRLAGGDRRIYTREGI